MNFQTLPFLNFDEFHILERLEGLSWEGLQTRVDDFFSKRKNKLISIHIYIDIEGRDFDLYKKENMSFYTKLQKTRRF
jgi:hypothetical protein